MYVDLPGTKQIIYENMYSILKKVWNELIENSYSKNIGLVEILEKGGKETGLLQN